MCNLIFQRIYNDTVAANSLEALKDKLQDILNHKSCREDINAAKDGNFYFTAAYQLAYEGNTEKVEWLRELGAYVDCIAIGYARANNDELVKYYKENHKVKDNWIIWGYALVGNIEKVNEYLGQDQTKIDFACAGYFRGGFYQQALDCYNKDKVRTRMIIAYALSSLSKSNQKTNCTRSLPAQKTYLNFILELYLDERAGTTDSSGKTVEYYYGSIFSFFQKSYTEKTAAVEALKKALQGEYVCLMPHLSTLRNGTLGEELRRFIKAGEADLIVGKKVDTVSDFIQALQESITRLDPATLSG